MEEEKNFESEKMDIKPRLGALFGSIDHQSATKRDVEILAELTNILTESQQIKGSYRVNESNSNQIDFFLGDKYIESGSIAPIPFLEFRIRVLENGFSKGVLFGVQKVLEKIQKDRTDESK